MRPTLAQRREEGDILDTGIAIAIGLCWATIVVVWIAGAVVTRPAASRVMARGRVDVLPALGAIVLAAAIVIAGRPLAEMLVLTAPWARLGGLALLVAATAFALWARLRLGAAWTISPRVPRSGGLRTDGPYAITRHPIYTGLLGMLIGTSIAAGGGQWLVMPAVGLLTAMLKIRDEERLLGATFPAAYAAYRAAVPALVPGLAAVSGRLGRSQARG